MACEDVVQGDSEYYNGIYENQCNYREATQSERRCRDKSVEVENSSFDLCYHSLLSLWNISITVHLESQIHHSTSHDSKASP